MLSLINPVPQAEPFDHPDWVFEAKFDGFRAAADTVRGQLISRNGNRMQRFKEVLDLLPAGLVLDGELVVLDDTGRPLFVGEHESRDHPHTSPVARSGAYLQPGGGC